MRSLMAILGIAILVAAMAAPAALAGKGACQQDRDRVCDPGTCPNCQYVDANGDGVCDKCGTCVPKGADDDGDGIPNGQDPDYQPPRDGSGRR